jgi:hypothetical protein
LLIKHLSPFYIEREETGNLFISMPRFLRRKNARKSFLR